MRAAISFSTIASQPIVAAEVGKVVLVKTLVLVAAGSTTITPKSATTALGGAMSLVVGVPLILPYADHPWLRTATAEAFNLDNSASVQVSGFIEYEMAVG